MVLSGLLASKHGKRPALRQSGCSLRARFLPHAGLWHGDSHTNTAGFIFPQIAYFHKLPAGKMTPWMREFATVGWDHSSTTTFRSLILLAFMVGLPVAALMPNGVQVSLASLLSRDKLMGEDHSPDPLPGLSLIHI